MDWAFVAEDADAYQDLSRSVERDSRPEVVLITTTAEPPCPSPLAPAPFWKAAGIHGPSVHGPATDQGHDDGPEHGDDAIATAIDPVSGMTVEPDTARARSLYSSHEDRDFFFCGKGCKLEFDDDPRALLDPSYVPSM